MYIWKRFARIYPVYWVVLFFYGIILIFSPTKDRSEQNIANVIATVFLIPQPRDPILSVAWTLRHEVLFYFIFGILVLNRRVGQAVMAIWGALIVWNIATASLMGASYWNTFPGNFIFRVFNIEFFFGMFVASLLRRWRPFCPLT